MKRYLGGLLGVFALLGLYASPAWADLVFSLDAGHFGPGTYGTVTLSQEATNVVEVTVTLTAGMGFVNTGAGDPILFNITGNPTITETDFNNTAAFSAGSGAPGQSIHIGGAGDFEYTVVCSGSSSPNGCGTGGNSPNPGPLSFDVTATGLTLSSFSTNGTAYFAADICKSIAMNGKCASGSNTGVVYATTGIPTTTTVPEPTTLALFGVGLLGLAAFGTAARRSKPAV